MATSAFALAAVNAKLHAAYYRGNGPEAPYRCGGCRSTYKVSDQRRACAASHGNGRVVSDGKVDAYRTVVRMKEVK